MKILKIFLLFPFIISFSITSKGQEPHNIAMFLDFNAEEIWPSWGSWLGAFLPGKPPLLSFPDPTDNAVLDDFLIALSQEPSAIILVNNKLWNAFASRRNLVCQEILKAETSLSKAYKLYQEIRLFFRVD